MKLQVKKNNTIMKFIAFGAGQCSSVLPFILNDYDLIIFADTGLELPLTYEWIKIIEKTFPEKFVRIKTEVKESHPPICTKEAKILPIRRYLRSIGVKKAIKYLGYTFEEKNRRNVNSIKWIINKYPLIERGWKRKDCQKYLLDNFGFIPPRSGCIICKYFNRHHLIKGIKIKNNCIENYI